MASGKNIDRMSDYCRTCRFRPADATGQRACPFTTLYGDFLMLHEQALGGNARMRLQLRNLRRLGHSDRKDIKAAAGKVRSACHAAR